MCRIHTEGKNQVVDGLVIGRLAVKDVLIRAGWQQTIESDGARRRQRPLARVASAQLERCTAVVPSYSCVLVGATGRAFQLQRVRSLPRIIIGGTRIRRWQRWSSCDWLSDTLRRIIYRPFAIDDELRQRRPAKGRQVRSAGRHHAFAAVRVELVA